jgi:hypothetical protein
VCGIEIGVGLTAFGLFFMMMGVMMLFDAGLMAIGNVRTIKREYNNILTLLVFRYCFYAVSRLLLDHAVPLCFSVEKKS